MFSVIGTFAASITGMCQVAEAAINFATERRCELLLCESCRYI